ncbi:MAG: hypothetical protein JW812_02530 [Alphaproteobacteria bacterium]|nr:hypothetical protein [Alphaproteobacteria bacterium]
MRLLSILFGMAFILSAGTADAKGGFFHKYDKNRDDVVTLEEFRLGKNSECDLGKKAKSFENKDKNKDEQLSKFEFLKCETQTLGCNVEKK